MLTEEIKQTLKNYTASMKNDVTLVLSSGEHPKRSELIAFLSDIAGVSEKIHLEIREGIDLRSPVSFFLEKKGADTGIHFSGIPSGHEFNSMVLAILQASGTAIKLDDSIVALISRIGKPLSFEVFISLSCHNCPEVVQTLNQFALLNPNISSEMIDGGLFQDVIQERDIQGVPSVYLNGERFQDGNVTASELIEKLTQYASSTTEESSAQLSLQDVVVVGGGPAGVSSAIYSARKGLKVTLIADRIGGQVKDTMGIENLISVPMTTGPGLSSALYTHLKEYDVTIKEHLRVSKIEQGDIKSVELSSGQVIHTKSIIIATGAKWRELGVPGEKEYSGKGVAYCPHCDGPFFKNKDVAVIGGGNSGIEAALDLAGIVKSVIIFEFMRELKADKVLVDQALKRDNIQIKTHVATRSILANSGKVSGIEYVHRDTEAVNKVDVDGVFIQIGLQPNSQFLGDLVKRTRFDEIIINDKCETSEAGIFACGDVTTVPFKQIIISMGEGAKASLSCFEYLLTRGDHLDEVYEETYSRQKDAA